MAEQRDMFGRALGIEWDMTSGSPAEIAAAYRQHLVAFAVNQGRRAMNMTLEQFAGHINVNVETFRRKIRGEGWISWLDASIFAQALPSRRIYPDWDDDIPPAP